MPSTASSPEIIDLHLDPSQSYTLGIVSDTHIPDRSKRLNPQVLSILREAHVSAILHGGDVSSPWVLDTLREIAPVIAVQGNRDTFAKMGLPRSVLIQAGEVEIGLTHGHGSLWRYLVDKLHLLINGPDADFYHRYLRDIFPTARVIVYGHTHISDETWEDGCLYFNPGAASPPALPGMRPGMGLIYIGPQQSVRAVRIELATSEA